MIRQSDLKQDEVAVLEEALQGLWALGRNIILAWTPRPGGLDAVVIPHYAIADFAGRGPAATGPDRSPKAEAAFPDPRPRGPIEDIISGPKRVPAMVIARIARLLGTEPVPIDLPFAPGKDLSFEEIDSLVKRYSISYVADRAVALFDIVGFSLLPALEQVAQLNSLAYSVNSAYAKMLNRSIEINFGRTTTGDGFYIWNRDRSIQANINLYHFMHLVLADNAIARSKSKNNAQPLLRTCFHVGDHYEFYQPEGLSPTVYSYIVGDVTIALARMIEKAMPGQVLVGDFRAPMADAAKGETVRIDTVRFIERMQATLDGLKGVVLSGDGVQSMKCYLTGKRLPGGAFAIKKYRITDKHGHVRDVYNAKINIYREHNEPVFLGMQNTDLGHFDAASVDFVSAA